MDLKNVSIQKAINAEVLDKKLSVMDLTAITLCEENSMPIRVFNGTVEGNIYKVLKGEEMGTFIK